MFDRPTTPPSSTPEELLDRWLDALNQPNGSAPTTPPPEIEGIATIARHYRQTLGDTTATHCAVAERNSSMNHVLPLSTANRDTWQTINPPRRRPSSTSGWLGWITNGLATALVVALLVALGGAMIIQQTGLPGGSDNPTALPGMAGQPNGTPEGGTLDCSSPGYRPVVEGEVNDETLAAIGETETPLNIDGAHVNIPTASGEIVTLSNNWTPVLGGPLWANPSAPNTDGDTTILNVDTGQEWTFPDQSFPFPGIYSEPYLLVPANSEGTDFRIIDTITGDERLVSEIRGEPFAGSVHITRIASDPRELLSSDTSLWLFNPDIYGPLNEAQPTSLPGPNTLVLPANMEDAVFLEEAVDAAYFHETVFSPESNLLAFATDSTEDRSIVVLNPETGDKMTIEHDSFSDDVLPLMFSEDGATLIVEQQGQMLTVDLSDEPSVEMTYEPDVSISLIAHNPRSMNVLVVYPDDDLTIINAITGEVMDLPGVTLPESEFQSDGTARRLSFERTIYDLFDDTTNTLRTVNLETGSISAEMSVFNAEEDSISAAFQPEFQYYIPYPHTAWSDGYAFLDETGTLRAFSTTTGEETWSIPAPEDFTVDADEVVQVITNLDDDCFVLNVAQASGHMMIRDGERSDRVTSWIAPLEPGAEWTMLDIQLTGWFPIYEELNTETLPAQDIASPVATPGG